MLKNSGFIWADKTTAYINVYESLEKKYRIYSHSAKSLLQFLHPQKQASILELACGTGISTKKIIKAGLTKITCFDISKAMLKRAKQQLKTKALFLSVDFTKPWPIKKKFNYIFSSFAYFYFIPNENFIFKEAFKHLSGKGVFIFNVTSYLREFCIDNTKLNSFFNTIYFRLDKFLKSQGFKEGIGNKITISKTTDDSVLLKKQLIKAGFKNIQFHLVSLPLNPYQAFEFTLRGFYSQGAKMVFSSTLSNLPQAKKIYLLETFIKQNKKYLTSLPNIKIFEVKAEK